MAKTTKSFRDSENLALFVDSLITNLTTKNQNQGNLLDQRIAEKKDQLARLQAEIDKLENDKGFVGREAEVVNASAHDYYTKLSLGGFEGDDLSDLFKHRLNSRFNPTPTAKKPVEKLQLVVVKPTNDEQIALVEGALDRAGMSALDIAKKIAPTDPTALAQSDKNRTIQGKWIKPCLDWLISQGKCEGVGEGKGKVYRLPQ